MLLQTTLFRKLLSTGFALKTSTVLLLNVLIKLLLLLEAALAMVALEELHLVLFVFVHVEQHRLCSRVSLSTSAVSVCFVPSFDKLVCQHNQIIPWTRALRNTMSLFEMPAISISVTE